MNHSDTTRLKTQEMNYRSVVPTQTTWTFYVGSLVAASHIARLVFFFEINENTVWHIKRFWPWHLRPSLMYKVLSWSGTKTWQRKWVKKQQSLKKNVETLSQSLAFPGGRHTDCCFPKKSLKLRPSCVYITLAALVQSGKQCNLMQNLEMC